MINFAIIPTKISITEVVSNAQSYEFREIFAGKNQRELLENLEIYFPVDPLVSITVRLLLPLDRPNRVAAAALRSTARMRWGFILGWLPTASHSALLFRQCAAHSASVRTAPTFHCRFRSGLSEHSPPEQRRLGRAPALLLFFFAGETLLRPSSSSYVTPAQHLSRPCAGGQPATATADELNHRWSSRVEPTPTLDVGRHQRSVNRLLRSTAPELRFTAAGPSSTPDRRRSPSHHCSPTPRRLELGAPPSSSFLGEPLSFPLLFIATRYIHSAGAPSSPPEAPRYRQSPSKGLAGSHLWRPARGPVCKFLF
jgi:hypothetical protein